MARRATPPQVRPKSRPADSATMITKKKPRRVQRAVQASGALSTPLAVRSHQPGGRWTVPPSCSTSADHPTAGNRPTRAIRESASRLSWPLRSSTPRACDFGLAVMSCSVRSRAARPSSLGRCTSSRHVRARVPEKVSRTEKAPPERSSQSSRRSRMRSGGGSGSPRRTCFMASRCPASTTKAGSLRHSGGRSVREGSTGGRPLSSTWRSVSSAAKTHTSRGGQGSSTFGGWSASGWPCSRARTVTVKAPARTWTRNRPEASSRAGRLPKTATGIESGRRAPRSSTSRAFPETSRLSRVSAHRGIPSTMRRKA